MTNGSASSENLGRIRQIGEKVVKGLQYLPENLRNVV
jgi:hypothetical protein